MKERGESRWEELTVEQFKEAMARYPLNHPPANRGWTFLPLSGAASENSPSADKAV